jgi:hypothetical protein
LIDGHAAVRFRVYLPEGLSPTIVGVRGDDLNGNGPLREDQPRVSLSREGSDDTKPGYRLWSGIGQYDTTLAGQVQEYKFKFELSTWTEAPWRSFTVPDQDTTLQWTYPNNAYPVVKDDEVTMKEDTTVTFNPVSNDSDPEGKPLRIDSLGSTSNGTASVLQDSLVKYVPDTNYSGSETFRYFVEDADGAQAKGQIKINVENINDPRNLHSIFSPKIVLLLR